MRAYCLEVLGTRGDDPGALTLDDVDEVQRELRRTGRFGAARLVRTTLRRIGARAQIGPFADVAEADADLVILRHPDVRPLNQLEQVIALLARLGFPPAFGDALQYHHDASRLPLSALRADRRRFPANRIRSQVTAGTYLGALKEVRIFLGVAVHRLGRQPGAMTLEATFGEDLPLILAAVQEWWAVRALEGEVTAPNTSALASVMRTAGSLAYTLFRQSMHRRRQEARQAAGESPRMAEEFVTKTVAEEDWYQGYRDASAMAGEVEAEIANSQHGGTKTTWKDIERVVAQTPFAYWLRTLRAMHDEVRRRQEAGDASRDFHWLVQQAYKLGVQISTGMRPEELYHVRLDNQYRPDHRRLRIIKLRPVDRKNASRHTVGVQGVYVPAWLEALYLFESRPALMRGDAEAHSWLFVTRTGRPVGCAEEDAEGKGRDDEAYSDRMTQQRLTWQDDVGAFAFQANGGCPTERGYFTPYLIRNATAAEIYRQHGTHKAAEYLGDEPKVVRDTYGFLDGSHSHVERLAGDPEAATAPLRLDA